MIDQDDRDERIRRGQEALNQLNDSLMAELIPAFRCRVLEELVQADAADRDRIFQLQAKISVIDELRDELDAFLLDADDLSRNRQSFP